MVKTYVKFSKKILFQENIDKIDRPVYIFIMKIIETGDAFDNSQRTAN